jgi:hypothetical protein
MLSGTVIPEKVPFGKFALARLRPGELAESPYFDMFGAGDNRRPHRSAYSVFKKAIRSCFSSGVRSSPFSWPSMGPEPVWNPLGT